MSPFRPWRTVAATLTLLAVAAAPAAATPSSTTSLSGPTGTSAAKVLVIGIDGTRWDVLRSQMAAGRAPNLKALADGGFLTPTSVPSGGKLDQTLSGPSWNTILRGVWEDKHRVDSNSDCDYDHHASYPDVLTRLERSKPPLSTFAAATWGNITTADGCGPYVSDDVDAKYHPAGTATDAATAGEAARYLTANGPDAGFVHLDEVDEAGHASGGTPQAYRDAVAAADVQVGRLIAAIEARPSYVSERWQVLVTTDHGHLDAGGHGGASAAERTSWIIGDELGAASNELPSQSGVLPGALRVVDLAPTVLRHLGVTPQASWGLDGRAIGTGGGDVFDTRSGALSPAATETPRSVLERPRPALRLHPHPAPGVERRQRREHRPGRERVARVVVHDRPVLDGRAARAGPRGLRRGPRGLRRGGRRRVERHERPRRLPADARHDPRVTRLRRHRGHEGDRLVRRALPSDRLAGRRGLGELRRRRAVDDPALLGEHVRREHRRRRPLAPGVPDGDGAVGRPVDGRPLALRRGQRLVLGGRRPARRDDPRVATTR